MARVSVEDCLKYVENRFALVSVASHRARDLMNGSEPLVHAKNKEMVVALREIAEGLVIPTEAKSEPDATSDLAVSAMDAEVVAEMAEETGAPVADAEVESDGEAETESPDVPSDETVS